MDNSKEHDCTKCPVRDTCPKGETPAQPDATTERLNEKAEIEGYGFRAALREYRRQKGDL